MSRCGEDQQVLDEFPDDASHLVTVELYYRAFDLDLGHMGHTTRAGWYAEIQLFVTDQ